MTASPPSVAICLDVASRPGVCPECGAPVAWFKTTAQRWACFNGAAPIVPEFERYVPRSGGAEVQPFVGYIAETWQHACPGGPRTSH